MAQDFPCRLLHKNHQKIYPRRMVFLDAETEKSGFGAEERHYLKLAWACYVERRTPDRNNTETWERFDKTYLLWRWITDHAYDETVLYIFGHNIQFDLQASDFFHFLTAWGWSLDFYHDRGLSYALFIRNGKQAIRVISTTNFYPEALEKVGEFLGLPKKPVDFNSADLDTLSMYCRRDVEIVKLAMEKYFAFIQENDLGKFGVTKAAQSMHAFRHRFMTTKVFIHGDPEVTEFERSAYIGGRTEAFFLGDCSSGPFVSLDVNSMYPYVMRYNKYPTKLINYWKEPGMDQAKELITKYGVVAEADIETDRPIYALRHDKKIIFPIGRFRAFLCTPGLQMAIREKHLIKVHRLAIYQMADLFKDYVDNLHALRVEYQKLGNKTYEEILKILLNALYGKWAQYVPQQEEIDDITFDGFYREEILCADTGERIIEYKMFNTKVQETGRMPGKNSFVAISAHVTEYARLVLWQIMKPLWPDKILYCDTDSLKIAKDDLPLIQWPMDKRKLGHLKIDDESKYLEIRGAKSYVTEKKRVLKGIPKRAQEIEPYVYEYLSFPGQVSHMRDRITRYFRAKTVRRIAKPFYDKGEVLKDGKIMPFRLAEF